MNNKNFKDTIYFEYSKIGKCLSSPKRIEILDLLISGPKNVDKLSKLTNMSIANVSKHLQSLLNANLVTYTKRGNHVIYQLADNDIIDFLSSFFNISNKQISTIDKIKKEFLDIHSMKTVNAEDLNKKVNDGEILLIDVRPTEEYQNGHFPRAVSLPIEELEEKLDLLPTNVEIDAYCRGSLCLTSNDAVKI